MKIRELNLKNFGKFSGQSFRFCNGINVIYGPNEAGKTTIYHALGALLFGLEKQRGRAARTDTYTAYQPWENKTWYEGSLRFETGSKIFYLERNFYHHEKEARLVCETDGEELSVEDGDLEMLLGDINGELYFNTAAVGQLKMRPQDIIYSYLKNYIAGVQEAGRQAMDVVKALNILENRKKALEQQKKKKAAEIMQQLTKIDSALEVIGKEITECQRQLNALNMRISEADVPVQQKGFFALLLRWLKRIFKRRRLRREAQQKHEERLKKEEKIKLLRELLGEKESLQEEMILEKDSFFEKLHEQSKDKEIKAIELAMERIRELSSLGKEEVMQKLLDKTAAVLVQMTGGKYQKLILEENAEPLVWDGRKTVKLFHLSTGCVDQVYLALRIGLQDLFFEEEALPLMFDDAFVYFDDERLEQLLMYLKELDRQVLLFTCHKRELRILEKHRIPYRKILI